MISDAELALLHLAQAQGLRRYGSLRRCPLCGTDERYVNGMKCVECARQCRARRSAAAVRAQAGSKPTKADRLRSEQRRAKQEDRRLRVAAASDRRTSYSSRLDCVRGHREPERYVSSGGCIACALAAARRQYSKRRK